MSSLSNLTSNSRSNPCCVSLRGAVYQYTVTYYFNNTSAGNLNTFTQTIRVIFTDQSNGYVAYNWQVIAPALFAPIFGVGCCNRNTVEIILDGVRREKYCFCDNTVQICDPRITPCILRADLVQITGPGTATLPLILSQLEALNALIQNRFPGTPFAVQLNLQLNAVLTAPSAATQTSLICSVLLPGWPALISQIGLALANDPGNPSNQIIISSISNITSQVQFFCQNNAGTQNTTTTVNQAVTST